MLSLRVLVDRVVIEVCAPNTSEVVQLDVSSSGIVPATSALTNGLRCQAFAQGGRATWATFAALAGNQTSLVWHPPANAGEHHVATVRPKFSLKVWSMKTGYASELG